MIAEIVIQSRSLGNNMFSFRRQNKSDIVFDNAMSRLELKNRAARMPERTVLPIARHLARLRNFGTASELLLTTPTKSMSFSEQCFMGTVFLNSTHGVKSDHMMRDLIRRGGHRHLPRRDAMSLGEWVQLSGLTYEDKISVLREIVETSPDVHQDSVARASLRHREFIVMRSNRVALDVRDFMQAGPDGTPYTNKSNLKYALDLVKDGFDSEARRLLTTLVDIHGLTDQGVLEATLRYNAGELIADIEGVFGPLLSAPGVLALAHDACSQSLSYQSFFDRCLAASTKKFEGADIYYRDSLLRVLTVKDLLPEFKSLVPNLGATPDTMLAALCGHGLLELEGGQTADAVELFESVICEDPAYTAAATGLRFALARRVAPRRSVIDVRNEVGYGAASGGRVGVRRGDRDLATSLLLDGDYLKSWQVRDQAPQWLTLKEQLGDKFLNYEPLPTGKGGRLFLIADDGVGDEIRTAQFLPELATYFDVTATCDPRLLPLFMRSFPDIEFIGVPRRIRGILNPLYDGRYSDFILASHISSHCDDRIARSDFVTFGQNLMFNRFAGTLDRKDRGEYLKPDPERSALVEGRRRLRVGLVWKSHFASASRRMMYINLPQLAPLLGIENVEYWSLQHASSPDEEAYCRDHEIRQFHDIDLFDDFEGLASITASLDLVIGISTVPMEVAAAVGTSVWLLGFSPENYLYRTGGGKTSVDQLSRNSTVVAPSWIDFSRPYEECVAVVVDECRRRLVRLAANHMYGDE